MFAPSLQDGNSRFAGVRPNSSVHREKDVQVHDEIVPPLRPAYRHAPSNRAIPVVEELICYHSDSTSNQQIRPSSLAKPGGRGSSKILHNHSSGNFTREGGEEHATKALKHIKSGAPFSAPQNSRRPTTLPSSLIVRRVCEEDAGKYLQLNVACLGATKRLNPHQGQQMSNLHHSHFKERGV